MALNTHVLQSENGRRHQYGPLALQQPIPLPVSKFGIPDGLEQALLMALIVAMVFALSSVGLSGVAKVLYFTVGVLVAAYYSSRSPWLYLTMTLWFWTVTPLARRLIDLHGGFDPVNFVLGVPNLMTLLMLKDILKSRDILSRRESATGLFLLLPIVFGVCVSFVKGDLIAAASGSADWIAPVLCYFYFIANWHSVDRAEPIFRRFLAANSLFMVSYAVFQFVVAPPWDVAWMLGSGSVGIMGHPEPFGMRIFGTLNAVGVYAAWIGAILILNLGFASGLSAIVVPVASVLLAMSLVRSVTGAVIIGLVLAGMLGRRGIFKIIGFAAVGVTIALAATIIVLPDVADQMQKRLDSIQNLDTDLSARERSVVWEESPALIDEHPLGLGLGGVGRGAVAGAGNAMAANAIIDFGPLAIYLALGWVGGSVYLIGMVLLLLQAIIAARKVRSSAAIALAVTGVFGALQLPFVNVTGLMGAIIWVSVGYASALGMRAQVLRAVPAQFAR